MSATFPLQSVADALGCGPLVAAADAALEKFPYYPGWCSPVLEKAYVAYFVTCSAAFVLFFIMSALFGPRHFTVFNHLMIAVSVVSVSFPAAIIPLVVWPGLQEVVNAGWADVSKFITYPTSPSIEMATGMSVGYMTYDFIVLILFYPWFKRPKDKSKRKKGQIGSTLYLQMLMHHILSILIWPISATSSIATGFIAYFMFTELTNTGLNARALLEQYGHGDGSISLIVVSLMWVLQFTVIRIIPMPLFIYFFFCGDYSTISWQMLALCLSSVPIPFILNLMWFNDIVGILLVKVGLKAPRNKKKVT